MIKTRVTELLGIEHPIVGGCMMHISGPEFVASISNAGALGMMASAMFVSQDEFRQAVRLTKSLTDKPFGVNLNLSPAMRAINNLFVDVILDEGVGIVETSGYRPMESMLTRLSESGVKVMYKSDNLRHALMAQTAGVDAVTVCGSECGGYIGEFGLMKLTRHVDEAGMTSMTLIPLTNNNILIPFLAAGGIVDGRGLLAALTLGAEGVTMGTRLLLTEECPIHEDLKEELLAATETDTIPILGSVYKPVHAWKNAASIKVKDLEAKQAGWDEIKKVIAGEKTKRMYEEGDLNLGVMSCGQSIAIVNEIMPVAEVIRGMVQEAEAIQKKTLKKSDKSVDGITPTGAIRGSSPRSSW